MSHCSQTFSVVFLEFLKRRHLKNLKKSSNKFMKNKANVGTLNHIEKADSLLCTRSYRVNGRYIIINKACVFVNLDSLISF